MAPSQEWFTAKEIADRPGMPGNTRNVKKVANRCGYRTRTGQGSGGPQLEFHISSLPAETRLHIAKEQATAWPSEILAHPDAQAAVELANQWRAQQAAAAEERRMVKENAQAQYAALPRERQRTAEARMALVHQWKAFLRTAGAPIHPATKQFIAGISSGELDLPPWIRNALLRKTGPALSYASLNRWWNALEELGPMGLVPAFHNPSKGQTTVVPSMQAFLKALLLRQPRASFPQLEKSLEARFQGQEIPHRSSIARFVNGWKAENQSRLLFADNPDAWKSAHGVAFGQADEQVERLLQLFEMDTTPADVLLKDGKRHVILGVIDVFSRRLKLHVSRTSTGAAVCSLLRSALLAWGVPEQIKTDNGSDYTSRRVRAALAGLEVEHLLCPPFTPEAKGHIERSFFTFSHGIAELLPGFIGHDVGERKAIEARKTFAERLMKRGETVEIGLDAQELQSYCDRWTEALYHQDPHAGLGGKTPAEAARAWTQPVRRISNERALDMLLLPAPNRNGLRQVGKKGIQVEGRCYIAAELGSHVGEDVLIRMDEADLGRIFVFDATSRQFLTMAEDPEWTGISRADVASHAKAVQKELQAQWKKEKKELLREAKLDGLAHDILAHKESQLANVAELPKPSEAYTTPDLEEAAKAAEQADGRASSPFDNVLVFDANRKKGPAALEPEKPLAEVQELFRGPEHLYDVLSKKLRKDGLSRQEKERLLEAYAASEQVRMLAKLEGMENYFAQG